MSMTMRGAGAVTFKPGPRPWPVPHSAASTPADDRPPLASWLWPHSEAVSACRYMVRPRPASVRAPGPLAHSRYSWHTPVVSGQRPPPVDQRAGLPPVPGAGCSCEPILFGPVRRPRVEFVPLAHEQVVPKCCSFAGRSPRRPSPGLRPSGAPFGGQRRWPGRSPRRVAVAEGSEGLAGGLAWSGRAAVRSLSRRRRAARWPPPTARRGPPLFGYPDQASGQTSGPASTTHRPPRPGYPRTPVASCDPTVDGLQIPVR
ncbi:hypothetical protein SAMN04489717_0952 [Actinopolymorpha singaporensis]|uniref:Uncharacterized protein n=1 Tax=Actinopolymorpha singaporensis TaxID=117157 RepID=A0A1H1MTD8_9ACTN|nr:hypothetical protein SAMN04489717_0952 [Actinopolymorpha singaporensis]